MNRLLVVCVLLFYSQICHCQEYLFKNFQQTHNKTYSSETELALREQIFNENLVKIHQHNEKYFQGLESYKMGINQFTDLTREEFIAKFNNISIKNFNLLKSQNSAELKADDLPKTIDWRDMNAVTPVKNQENCGGCWAFSVTGLLEGHLAIKTGNLISLSEQELLDCDTEQNGCLGGVIQYALDYVIKNGLASEENYRYEAEKQTCQRKHKVVTLQSYRNIFSNNETDLKLAVGLIGPVSVAVNADDLSYYESGLFDPKYCSNEVNHGVLLVGYGNENGRDYWILKNSWGGNWGENGYYRMPIGRALCGIASQACYPIGVASGAPIIHLQSVLFLLLLMLIGF